MFAVLSADGFVVDVLDVSPVLASTAPIAIDVREEVVLAHSDTLLADAFERVLGRVGFRTKRQLYRHVLVEALDVERLRDNLPAIHTVTRWGEKFELLLK
jgi:hypothetical protein